MSPGSSTESCSYWVEGKPGKNLNQVTCPDRDSNPGHLVLRPDALTITPQSLASRGSHSFSRRGSLKVTMDEIKAELEVDPLALETSDDSDEKEKKCILETVLLSTQIKIEGEDNIYDLASEMNYEFQEGNLSHLEVTDMKTECRDNNYVIKTEIKVENTTPVPTSFPVVKSEVDPRPLMMMLWAMTGLRVVFPFQICNMSTEDMPRSGHPSTGRNDENIAKIKRAIDEDRRKTID
ncbi:hypothetical protein ANN_27468 [Periplaneta americana]|uniref:Uncharacterized protein n=1 Tax=Periplaneta americana TaxID=6978 RepID=A0ABQ8RW01_PERAM|nr:hypothetical protein ANN_27468 [Periplaneta americana]